MDKKSYLAPEFEVVEIQVAKFLCASGDGTEIHNPGSEVGEDGDY